jgi:hypothetical protein
MADFGLIKPAFWSVEQRGWSDAERALGAYLLSCRHRNLEGFYELPLGYVVTDLNWSPNKTQETLASLIRRRFCDYDEAAEVVFVCKSLKHLAPKGIPRIKGAVRSLGKVPPTHLIGPFYEACRRYAPDLWKELGEPTADGIDTPSVHPQVGSDEPSHTPTSGYSEAAPPETYTEADVEREAEEETEEEERAQVAAGIAAGVYHPRFQDVLNILEAVRERVPTFEVEKLAVNSACLAHGDADPVAAAHTVASWMHGGSMQVRAANVLLHRALDKQAEQAAKVKAAAERPAPFASSRRLSAADDLAQRERAAAEQLAREAAERGAA